MGLLTVRVQPRAGRNNIVVDGDGKVKVYVTTAPTDGKANEAVAALVAKRLGVAKSAVNVIRGLKSREKVLDIEGVAAGEAVDRLRA